jgi:hypothetical protein
MEGSGHRIGGKRKTFKGFFADDSGTNGPFADLRSRFEQRYVQPSYRQLVRGVQTRRSASDDNDVSQRFDSICSGLLMIMSPHAACVIRPR